MSERKAGAPDRESIPVTRRRTLPYGLTVLLCYLAGALLSGSLWFRDHREVEADARDLAREQGALVVELIQLSRQWNANHAGVWVRATPATPPNPYLNHPLRDLETVDGIKLTMVNPAYMTRQMAELAADADSRSSIRFHLTSRNPIRPDNAADSWESESLLTFEQGTADRLSYFAAGEVAAVADPNSPVYRYMAPLKVNAACMNCHASQGYQVGQVRGGISVTMEANSLNKMVLSRQRTAGWSYGALALLIGALLHTLFSRVYRHAEAMRQVQRDQEDIIAERTRSLVASEGRYRTVFDTATEAIMVMDEQGAITQVNPAFARLTGYAPDEVLGRPASVLRSGHHDAAFFAQMEACLVAQGHWEGDVWQRRKDGSLCVVWQSISRLPGSAGSIAPEVAGVDGGGYVATFFDITERKTEEDAARHRAQHDLLTELPNRGLFLDRLQTTLALSQRHQRQCAVLYFDLDKFKGANDSLGHAAGDAILQQTGQRALACVRASDTVARFGGDEFAILLAEIDGLSQVEEIARRLNMALAQPFFLSEGRAEVSASIGIALYPEHGATGEELQRRADEALYAVKRGGRNNFQVWSAAMEGAR